MAYGIEFFCGKKFGGWRMSSPRFPDAATAERESRSQTRDEVRAELTAFARRVRAA